MINGKNSYVRNNPSWTLGRLLRYFDTWMALATTTQLAKILNDKSTKEKAEVKEKVAN